VLSPGRSRSSLRWPSSSSPEAFLGAPVDHNSWMMSDDSVCSALARFVLRYRSYQDKDLYGSIQDITGEGVQRDVELQMYH
jgi:hypothetical protein